jgi:PhoH-like ATPase
MILPSTNTNRLLVLDTNVLMHDPTALFRFKEHDLYLPMAVIEELDNSKKGLTEVARNTRQVSRFLGEMVGEATQQNIREGLPLSQVKTQDKSISPPGGRLFLQTDPVPDNVLAQLPARTPDNSILAVTHSLRLSNPGRDVTLVTKDINLRIKAAMLGIRAEDYFNDKVIDDAALLYTGLRTLPDDFWETHSKGLESWQEAGHTFYRVTGPVVHEWQPNICLYSEKDDSFEAIVRSVEGDTALIELATDHRGSSHAVWGIRSRNREQNFAFNFLLDKDIDMVSLLGTAGTGKTLLALAAGLVQTLEQNLYREIIMTRVTIPVGEDIGFLPGTEEEKMTPWMGALMDNLEVLTSTEFGGEWGQNATQDLLRSRIKIRSLNFMRGRTFLNKYIIIDEAQNLTTKQLKTLLTRAGPGTKIICLGNLAQIDTPYLTETTSGLANVVDRFQNWPHSAHITLRRGERSRLADYASDNM